MFTEPEPQSGRLSLDAIAEARAAGVPWTELGIEAARPVNPQQLRQARDFLQFREGMPEVDDAQTAIRGARILRSDGTGTLGLDVWGLSGDPADPKAADFSDVSRALDQHAAAIHSRPLPGFFGNGGGKHAAQ